MSDKKREQLWPLGSGQLLNKSIKRFNASKAKHRRGHDNNIRSLAALSRESNKKNQKTSVNKGSDNSGDNYYFVNINPVQVLNAQGDIFMSGQQTQNESNSAYKDNDDTMLPSISSIA